MKDSSQFSDADRLESLKVGTLAALSLFVAFATFTLANSLILAQQLEIFASWQIAAIDLNLALRGAMALLNGFLFGVSYRYIIRGDRNPQLKIGGVFAFGLVRSSAQLEVGLWDGRSLLLLENLLPFVVMGVESLAMFAIAAFTVDFAFHRGWIKLFNSN